MKGILYAEFDVIAGPRILYQAPVGFLSDVDFDCISDYVIVKPELCGSLVSIVHSALNSRVLAFPVGLQHEKYERNGLLFTVCFVLDAAADTAPYEPVLRKLGLYLQAMEVESEFISDPRRKARLADILPTILRGLRQRGECYVAVDGAFAICLTLFPGINCDESNGGIDTTLAVSQLGVDALQSPARRSADASSSGTLPPLIVHAHDVPVPLRDLDVLGAGGVGGDDETSGWDLCALQIAPHVDGIKCARAVAEAADVEVGLALRALSHLHAYGVIALVDVFQYSNVYVTTPRIQLMLRDVRLRDAARTFVARDVNVEASVASGAENITADTAQRLSPSGAHDLAPVSTTVVAKDGGPAIPRFDDIFRVLVAFGAGARTGDVCAHWNTRTSGIDDRRLVLFGVLYGLLRRVHVYAIPTATGTRADRPAHADDVVLDCVRARATKQGIALDETAISDAISDARMTGSGALFDGTRNLDALCVSLCMSQSLLEEALRTTHLFAFIFV